MWMSHGTDVNESWHRCEWVMAHIPKARWTNWQWSEWAQKCATAFVSAHTAPHGCAWPNAPKKSKKIMQKIFWSPRPLLLWPPTTPHPRPPHCQHIKTRTNTRSRAQTHTHVQIKHTLAKEAHRRQVQHCAKHYNTLQYTATHATSWRKHGADWAYRLQRHTEEKCTRSCVHVTHSSI